MPTTTVAVAIAKIPSRSQVREVECPECEASAGSNCIGARDKVRTSNHKARWMLWEKMQELLVNP